MSEKRFLWGGVAGFHDKEGAKFILAFLAGRYTRMSKVYVDSAHRGLTA
jgi:hypothetical protein